MELPKEIEYKILELLGIPGLANKHTLPYTERINELRNEMYKLSADFAELKPTEEKYADAYFAYNFPMNLMKVIAVVNKLKFLYPAIFSNKDKIRILDIGCGEGAGILGLFYGLGQSGHFSITGIDISKQMLNRCQKITDWLKNNNPNVKVKLFRNDISENLFRKINKKFDIILFVNSIAEILKGNKIPQRFIELVCKCLYDDGIVIIIEPALKRFARRLMDLRNEMIKKENIYLLLPCLHNNECPLLELKNRKEWCHESLSWKPPYFMEALNKRLNREIDRLKFSFLIISKENHQRKFVNGFYVLSHLLKEKGKKRCFLCTPEGRVELTRLNKKKGKKNSEFDKISKGDLIVLKRIIETKTNYWQIDENTHVNILHSQKNFMIPMIIDDCT